MFPSKPLPSLLEIDFYKASKSYCEVHLLKTKDSFKLGHKLYTYIYMNKGTL